MSRAMKDSGIPWIGEIPSHWRQLRFKYAGSFEKGRLPNESNIEGIGLPIIGASEMLGKEPRQYTKENNLPVCTKTDILILWDGANAGIIANALQGVVSSTACKYTCADNRVHKQYLFFLLKHAETFFRSKVYGTTIPHMNSQYIDSIPLLLPSISEQQSIADFLDKKCSEIDKMISLQDKIIEELTAYKQSVITEAVCKGLNPDVPMKDSGIEWIGRIPITWGTPCIGYLSSISSGGTPDRNVPYYWENGSVNWFKTGELQNQPLFESEEKITETAVQNSSAKLFPCNTILVAMYGQGKTRGMSALLKTEGTTNQACAGIQVNSQAILTVYLWDCIIGAYNALRELAVGTGQPNLSIEQISNFRIPLPPIEEQKGIIDYIDKKTHNIDNLISLKISKIDALKEYKKSIIYEYITGKKEVNG